MPPPPLHHSFILSRPDTLEETFNGLTTRQESEAEVKVAHSFRRKSSPVTNKIAGGAASPNTKSKANKRKNGQKHYLPFPRLGAETLKLGGWP
jgi:hypothetical protein